MQRSKRLALTAADTRDGAWCQWLQIAEKDITLGTELGRGNFGCVYRGTIRRRVINKIDARRNAVEPRDGEEDSGLAVVDDARGSRGADTGPMVVAVKVPVDPMGQRTTSASGARQGCGTPASLEQSAALLLEAFVLHGLPHPRVRVRSTHK